MNTDFLKDRVRHIHFVGIGGAGMSGIAEVLLTQGYTVSGSDLVESPGIVRLRKLGAQIFVDHQAEHIKDAEVLVQSTAIDCHNPEIIAAHLSRIPVIPRAEMLAELMRFKYGIAIAGTHGKTTTTSLIAHLLAHAHLDPTFVIGGKLNSTGSNAHLGRSPYFIAEADESDASFLYLYPILSVVTNIDADHMATYQGDFCKLQQTFIQFLHNLPFYGLAILCVDDPIVKTILPQVARPMVTYGFAPDADLYAGQWRQEGRMSHFTVQRREKPPLAIDLNLPGRHNVLNTLAAIAVGTELKIPDPVIQNAFADFQGVDRRFQIQGHIHFEHGSAVLVDDYGHHPQEIRATCEAAHQVWPNQKIIMVFQPHRYSRTHDFFHEFVECLAAVDQLFLLDIYPAGEDPIPGIDSPSLCEKIKGRSVAAPYYIQNYEALVFYLTKTVREGDVLLTQGAGNVGELSLKLMQDFGGKK